MSTPSTDQASSPTETTAPTDSIDPTDTTAPTNSTDPTIAATAGDDLSRELAAERAHLITSRTALAQMRERAEALFATGGSVSGDPFAAESLGRQLARRIAELADDPTAPLFFGRLDFGTALEDHAGHSYHIGRRHVVDDIGEPLVLDWRAPMSRSVLPRQRARATGRRRTPPVRLGSPPARHGLGSDHQLRGRAPRSR